MPSSTRLIVGLGNPGSEYEDTRHNIGFMAVDAIAEHYGCASWKKKFKGAVASSSEQNLIFLKPMIFMNLSGDAVIEAVQFHKLAPKDVIVFHDELDLNPGQVKIKQGGGTAGHNGLKSIDAHIGPDFWRVRLGIGHPGSRDEVSNYVLHPFAKADHVWLKPLLDAAASEFGLMLDGKTNDYQNRISQQQAKE